MKEGVNHNATRAQGYDALTTIRQRSIITFAIRINTLLVKIWNDKISIFIEAIFYFVIQTHTYFFFDVIYPLRAMCSSSFPEILGLPRPIGL